MSRDILVEIDEQIKFAHDYDVPFLNDLKAEIKQLRASNERYIAARAKDDEEIKRLRNPWQPIETAPKDGKRVLGARFNTHLDGWEYSVIAWRETTWTVFPTKDMRLSHMASHWMPLPDPPEQTDE